MTEHSASSLSRLLPGKSSSEGGNRHVAKDRILQAEGGRVRRTRARSPRQGHARALSQISGFMAERGEAIRILARGGFRRDWGASIAVVLARARRPRLARAPERRAHGYDSGAARSGLILPHPLKRPSASV